MDCREILSYMGCPGCHKQLAVVVGVVDPVVNWCGYCHTQFSLMEDPNEPEQVDEEED